MKRVFGIGLRESLRRLTFAFGGLFAIVLLSDCADPGGPSLVTLGVDVEPNAQRLGGIGGTGTVTQRPADLCVRLPVLLGSRVEKSQGVAEGLRVQVNATRDVAEVTFPGADNDDTARSYRLGQLQLGVQETVILVAGGEGFQATIETGCTNP
jgi:hypothetical protein